MGLRGNGDPQPGDEADLPGITRLLVGGLSPTARGAALASSVSCLPAHTRFGLFLMEEAIFSHNICFLFIPLILLKCSRLSLTFVKMASPRDDFFANSLERLAKSQDLPLQFTDSATRRQDSVQTGFP